MTLQTSKAPNRKCSIIKNYRLNETMITSLKKIVYDVDQISPAKIISETDIIKGLIVLGSKTKPEKILKSIREAL